MSEKKESQRKTQTKMQLEIVNFLDIDTNEMSMYVKYEGVTPFGLKENFDKDGNYQGTSMQINCEDEYLQKAKELDRFSLMLL